MVLAPTVLAPTVLLAPTVDAASFVRFSHVLPASQTITSPLRLPPFVRPFVILEPDTLAENPSREDPASENVTVQPDWVITPPVHCGMSS